MRHRIAIVEDHLLQRHRTEELLTAETDFEIVFSAETMPEFIGWLRQVEQERYPHLLVLDLLVDRQPSVDPELVSRLVAAGLRIVVLSALASPALVRRILRAGVSGIVGKRDDETQVIDAVRAVLRGQEWMTGELAEVIAGDPERPALSAQEERSLVLYASGLPLKDVAEAMGVKPDTVKTYLQRVKSKYGARGRPVRSRSDLGRVALQHGYIDLDGLDATPDATDDPV